MESLFVYTIVLKYILRVLTSNLLAHLWYSSPDTELGTGHSM
jgi:hypothetical protein